MDSVNWKKLLERVPPESKVFMEKSADLVDQLYLEIQRKGWTQKQLAQAIGKSEAEISKWLSVGHNLTLRSIAKLEVALNASIVATPLRFESKATAGVDYNSLVTESELIIGERSTQQINKQSTGVLIAQAEEELQLPPSFPNGKGHFAMAA